MDEYGDLEAVLKKIKARFKPESLLKATYNKELTEVILEHTKKKSEIDELKKIAREKSDDQLLKQANKIEKETEKLKKEVSENRKELQQAVIEHEKTKKVLEVTHKQDGVLQSKADVSVDNVIDAMHIMKTYADSIDSNISEIVDMVRDGDEIDNILPVFHEIRQICSKILNTYNLVINTDYKADTGNKKMDIIKFTKEYVEKQWNHKLPVEIKGLDSMEVLFNPLEFSIIIDNIADNAIRYTDQNRTVNIFTGTVNGHAFYRVEDNGIGIPENEQKRIFERFYRVDKSHSRATGGTGLGLSIVKHGAILHNAEIKLESEPGKGTKMELVF